jgi:dynein heavy chain
MGNGQMVFFIDDLNLPEVDPYNTQSAIALLRQHLDYGHWYDRSKFTLKNIANCQYVTCMNPTSGSFTVNPRLQRHFTTFSVNIPGPTSLLTIYQTFLEGYLQPFTHDVQSMGSSLIKAALGLHKTVSEVFRKTAANFHYEFNIRHLSNVFQGLLMAQKDKFEEGAKFANLWLHESCRVYGDRLVSVEDLKKFQTLAVAQAKKTFPQYNMTKFFTEKNPDPLLFSHFTEGLDELAYNQCMHMDSIRKHVTDALREYNESNPIMDLVLFDDAVSHVARIARIIVNSAGHALLVGVGGSGKQSLSRLASHICNYSIGELTITQNFSIADLKTEIQSMYYKAGVKDEGVVFLFTDAQVTNERFLVYLNDILSSGNIPDLYTQDEKDGIIGMLTTKAKKAGYSQEAPAVWRYFITMVRKNLHCCLCFSPVGEEFRARARKFPALVNCTVIDWFQPWPKDALQSVGRKCLTELTGPGQVLENDTIRLGVESFMPYSFETVNDACKQLKAEEGRCVYTTPKTYLELLKLYVSLVSSKSKELDGKIARLHNGVTKLKETAESVESLEEALKKNLVEAEEKREASEEIAKQVGDEKSVVEKETARAQVEKDKVQKIAEEVSQKQAETERDLAKAEPMVAQAMAALDTLSKKDLGNCKTMTKPPQGVDDIFAAVTILLASVNASVIVQKNGKVKEKDRNWDASKKALLGNINVFIDELKGFKDMVDRGQIPAINWREVRSFLALEHFNPEIIEKKNSAAAGLCLWVINIVQYYDVVQSVEPKRIALAEANAILDAANEKKRQVEEEVGKLQAKLDKLNKQYEAATNEMAEAQAAAERGKRRLALAERLINALSSENVRWTAGIETLKEERSVVVGDVLIAASFISYIGPFPKRFRGSLISQMWIPFLNRCCGGEGIPLSGNVDPLTVLTTASEIANWSTQGLPSDPVSIENGAVVTCSSRWPLIIDPQLQGIYWVKSMESSPERNLQVVRLGQKDLFSKLEKAIEAGHSVMIENLGEKIDAILGSVISRTAIKRGKRNFLKIGDKEIEWNADFRLYLHTKLANPHYPPEIQAECSLVNFTVTPGGLEDQLLSLVVRKERADLAAQKAALIMQQNRFKIQIVSLENDILKKLAESEGDPTEDVELIEGLEEAKQMSSDLAEKAAVNAENEIVINKTSEKYRPVAARGALLFFIMNDLHRVHSYYIFSLNAFVVIFQRGIDLVTETKSASKGFSRFKAAAKKVVNTARFGWNQDLLRESRHASDNDLAILQGRKQVKGDIKELTDDELEARCVTIQTSITEVVYNFLRRGLFETDKLIISSRICFLIMQEAGNLDARWIRYFLAGQAAEEYAPMDAILAEWLPELIWAKVKKMEELGGPFKDLGSDITSDPEDWRVWFNEEKPEKCTNKLPSVYRKVPKFIHLMLLRAMRPDRVTTALSEFVATNLGPSFVTQPPFSLESIYMESSASTPMFFILFPGVDPTPWIEALGKKFDVTVAKGNLINISMGQGQEKPAENALTKYAKEGGWIVLQNVHLMQSWLKQLETKLESCAEEADQNFRCFISAEPPALSYMQNIPESLLQSCIKVANEAPADMQSNLKRTWANFSQEAIDSCNKPGKFKGTLFALCFFHSVVLGRCKFGQQGWSRAYSFNTGDLTICADVLLSYLNNNSDVPWDDLRYIFGEIMYGGHITDPWDRRTNSTYLQVLFHTGVLEGVELAPGFKAPIVDDFDYTSYEQYIEQALPQESPSLFGLHSNAEIGYLTAYADRIMQTQMVLNSGFAAANSEGGSNIATIIEDLWQRLPNLFDMMALEANSVEKLAGSAGPYVVVVLQECERMNLLLSYVRSSLDELRKGLSGLLSMSDIMEHLSEALSLGQVPGRNPFHACSWEKLAWPSKKGLQSWFSDMVKRVEVLQVWAEEKDMQLPFSIWLPGLFNPTALLTAVQQVAARKNGTPLDSMTIETHVTLMKTEADAVASGRYPEDGIYVHGLLIEGARWGGEEDEIGDAYPVGGNSQETMCAGFLLDSKLKELLPLLPVLYVRAIPVHKSWEPTSVGYLRKDPGIYECPVYSTSYRGETYVFLATLKSKQPTSKWILSGTAILLQSDD